MQPGVSWVRFAGILCSALLVTLVPSLLDPVSGAPAPAAVPGPGGGLPGTASCAPPSSLQQQYFSKIGIGANYGPDYNGPPQETEMDAKNLEMESSAPLDMPQLLAAGFQTVRAYGDPAKVWIAMLREAARLNQLGRVIERRRYEHRGGQFGVAPAELGLVYQVALCKSDAALSGHPCIDIPGTTFQQQLAFSLTQLQQVIMQVGPGTFQAIVKLILVGNEDLVISPTDNSTYNTADLQGALAAVKSLLQQNGLNVTGDPGVTVSNGIDLSSSVVWGQMTTPPGQALATAFTPGAPIVENIYPFMIGNDPPTAISTLAQRVAALQQAYPNNPAMIGETGWPTAGVDANYTDPTATGSLSDAQQYYANLYPYLIGCDIPTLVFEAYDQPTKGPAGALPTPPGQQEAEQFYGVFYTYNAVKSNQLLPPAASSFSQNYNTGSAAIFTFVGGLDSNNNPSPSQLTISWSNPDGTSFTRTFVPFRQEDFGGGQTLIWPTLNLYATSQGTSQVTLFRSDGSVACTNSVALVNSTARPNPPGPDIPAFSGGLWHYTNTSAPGCPDVNWGNNSGINAQNVFLPAAF